MCTASDLFVIDMDNFHMNKYIHMVKYIYSINIFDIVDIFWAFL